jgi:hypothetical protein
VSDTSQGEGWWLASDGKWYAPELRPAPPPSTAPGPGWWAASDGRWYAPELHPEYVRPHAPKHAAQGQPARTRSDIPPSLGQSAEPLVPDVPAPSPGRKARKHKWWYVVAAVSIVVVVILAISSGGGKGNGSSTSTTQARAATSPRATTTAPIATTTAPIVSTTTIAPAPAVLWHQSGSGVGSGTQFTVPKNVKGWNEVWSYDCSASGRVGRFISSVIGYGGAASTTDSGTNKTGTSGSGTNHYYDKGTFRIDLNSDCRWTDEAVTVPS